MVSFLGARSIKFRSIAPLAAIASIRLACRRKDLPQLAGVTIDFRDVGGSRGFVFRLPDHERTARANDASGRSLPPPGEGQVRRQALREVIDPEIGINIVDLGLVYAARVSGRDVHVTMTTPACPLSEHIKAEVDRTIAANFPGTRSVEVEIVWEPRWTPDAISKEAKQTLGWSR